MSTIKDEFRIVAGDSREALKAHANKHDEWMAALRRGEQWHEASPAPIPWQPGTTQDLSDAQRWGAVVDLEKLPPGTKFLFVYVRR
jgi:hypothetical protein